MLEYVACYQMDMERWVNTVIHVQQIVLSMNPSTQAVEQPPPRKTMLYCFNCGHESTVDGDWVIQKYDNCTDYGAPNAKQRLPPGDGRQTLRAILRKPVLLFRRLIFSTSQIDLMQAGQTRESPLNGK